MEIDYLINDRFWVYEQLERTPVELLTSKLLSEAIKLDIRCVGLVPEGMQVEGIPELSKQEIDDIRFINDSFMNLAFEKLPPERRTLAVSQAAVFACSLNLREVPNNILSDNFILDVLQKDGNAIFAVDEGRRTPEMYLTALENTGLALRHFPQEMITSEIALKAVEKNGVAIEYVPEELKTPKICRIALNDNNCLEFEVVGFVPFPELCMDYLKKVKQEEGDLFMAFGSIKKEIITPEMADLAVCFEPACIMFLPDRLKTFDLCAEAVGKDWMNMRFVPENRKSKTLCEIAMNGSIHAQQFVPEKWKTPEMYMYPMKVNGMDLEYVPENFRTPEVCLQAVISNRHAEDFLTEWTNKEYNIYEFYHKFKNENIIVEYLSFEHIQKAFQGETVHVSGIRFANNITLKNFTIDFDRNTHRLNVKSIDGTGKFEKLPEKKQVAKNEKKQEKRKGIKM